MHQNRFSELNINQTHKWFFYDWKLYVFPVFVAATKINVTLNKSPGLYLTNNVKRTWVETNIHNLRKYSFWTFVTIIPHVLSLLLQKLTLLWKATANSIANAYELEQILIFASTIVYFSFIILILPLHFQNLNAKY